MRETGSGTMRALKTMVTLIVAAAILAGLTGCSLISGEEEKQSISEYGGLYHFFVPEPWQVVADSTVMAIYASEEPPSDANALETLSVVIFNSQGITEDTIPNLLTEAIEARSAEKSWQDAEITEPEDTLIGGRAGFISEVTAKTADGVPFAARYYMIRTSGSEVLLVATMPAERYEEYASELDAMTEEWYWHAPESNAPAGSMEPTVAAEATETAE